jgi:hypothetical protein
VVTGREKEKFKALIDTMESAEGPDFLVYDDALVKYWDRLNDEFPDYQFYLVDDANGKTAGVGRCIPLAYSGTWAELPDEGLDWALTKGFQDQAAGIAPNMISALYIEIAAPYRGQHLSSQMLGIMREIGRQNGFQYLIAPVRPSLKALYPLIQIDRYMEWKTSGNLPFDPWLRVHVRVGGKVLHPCHRAMTVKGTSREWAAWTGMDFPSDGEYVIPFGLVPVSVKGEKGRYVEPGIWLLHELK